MTEMPVGTPKMAVAEAIGPNTALVTRLALLELLTTGSHAGPSDLSRPGPLSPTSIAPSQTVAARTQDAHERLTNGIARYKAIVDFVGDYSRNRPFLLPEVAGVNAASSSELVAPWKQPKTTDGSEAGDRGNTGGGDADTVEHTHDLLSPQSIAALVLDQELELKVFEQNLRACEHLGERGVAGAGKLAEYENLLPRLEEAKRELQAQAITNAALESRALAIMEQYSMQVDALSRIFINWDTVLTEAEQRVGHLERQKRQ